MAVGQQDGRSVVTPGRPGTDMQVVGHAGNLEGVRTRSEHEAAARISGRVEDLSAGRHTEILEVDGDGARQRRSGEKSQGSQA